MKKVENHKKNHLFKEKTNNIIVLYELTGNIHR